MHGPRHISFWYMSGISGACILDSGTSSFPVCTVGELCCAPVPICGTLFKYSYGRSNWRMLPAISRIYHLSCRGFFNVPCEIPGTRDLGFKSHPQDFFGPELGRILYGPPRLQLGETAAPESLSHALSVTTRLAESGKRSRDLLHTDPRRYRFAHRASLMM